MSKVDKRMKEIENLKSKIQGKKITKIADFMPGETYTIAYSGLAFKSEGKSQFCKGRLDKVEDGKARFTELEPVDFDTNKDFYFKPDKESKGEIKSTTIDIRENIDKYTREEELCEDYEFFGKSSKKSTLGGKRNRKSRKFANTRKSKSRRRR